MALINVPVIVILLKPVLRCLEDYTEQKKAGKNPVFKAENIGLKGRWTSGIRDDISGNGIRYGNR